jgi:hypothetical protein
VAVGRFPERHLANDVLQRAAVIVERIERAEARPLFRVQEDRELFTPGDVAFHADEHASAPRTLVHGQRDMVAQKTIGV